MQKISCFSLMLLAGAGAVACGDGMDETPPRNVASVTVVAAAGRASSVTPSINGQTKPALTPGQHVEFFVPGGSRSFSFTVQGTGVSGSSGTVDLVAGQSYLLIAQDSQGVVVGSLVADTGAIVPAGKSKLRVVHSAGLAPVIDVYRTQPDFPTLVSVMFPFAFGATSPYLQSDPGDWSVVVTPDSLTDTLYATGPIAVPDGGRVTVVIVDSTASGGISAVVLHEN